MNIKKFAWASRIDFRPDPSDPAKGAINLGLLLEFTTEDYWVLAMVMLASIDEAAFTGVDELSRKLIEARKDVIGQEVSRVLPRANKPGEALRLLAAANQWSMHVDTPMKLEMPVVRNAERTSVEKIAENYALSFFVRNRAPLARKLQAKAATAPAKTVAVARARIIVPDDCPPPWILTSCVLRPLHIK